MEERNIYTALREWFLTPQGQSVAEAFKSELKTIRSALHGKYLVQLGDCGENPWLKMFQYQRKWFISPNLYARKEMIEASILALPLERESVDCILAPLTLEVFSKHSPIDEMDRVLHPMGLIVFLGVNPWSFWGASLKWGQMSHFGQVSSGLSSSLSLKHAMIARGYRQCWLSSFYYIPPAGKEKWIHKMEFLNQMGKMVCPYPAGFYCLIMQKHDPCMTSLTAQDEFYLAQT